MSVVGQANALLSNVARIGFVAVSGLAVWLGFELHSGGEERAALLAEQGAEIERLAGENVRLAADVAVKQREIERLGLALRLSKVERRVARLIVLDQQRDGAAVTTRVRFEEVDAAGAPLGAPIEATLAGEQVYVDAEVVKFDDERVEAGDPLRGASLVLFRRLFAEGQAPSAGVALDRAGERPRAYGDDVASPAAEFEREIFGRFWELAHDPRRAAAAGVRAAHGEAPSMKVRKGEVYRITARAAGGLTFELDRPEAGVR